MSLVIGSVAASNVAASVYGVRPFRKPVTAVDKVNRLIGQRQAAPREVSISYPGRQAKFLPPLNNDATAVAPGNAYGLPVKMLKLMGNQTDAEAAEQAHETEGGQPTPRPEVEGEAVQAEPQQEADEKPEPNEMARPRGTDGEPLSDGEMRLINDLKQRDAEVRQHEQAHLASGGGYVRGGARFQYQTGPDNRRYVVGGEVSIDTSGEQTPEATARKMRTVRKAALAPAKPSTQDRRVAAAASRLEMEAMREIIQNDQEVSEDVPNPLSEQHPVENEQVGAEEEDSSTLEPAASASDQARELHRFRAAAQAYGIAA